MRKVICNVIYKVFFNIKGKIKDIEYLRVVRNLLLGKEKVF